MWSHLHIELPLSLSQHFHIDNFVIEPQSSLRGIDQRLVQTQQDRIDLFLIVLEPLNDSEVLVFQVSNDHRLVAEFPHVETHEDVQHKENRFQNNIKKRVKREDFEQLPGPFENPERQKQHIQAIVVLYPFPSPNWLSSP